MIRISILALTALLSIEGLASAQTLDPNARFAYSWRQVGASSPVVGPLQVQAGSNFTLEIWLRETTATTVLSTQNGLFGGGVRATYNSTPGVASVTSTANISVNPAFDDTPTFTGSVQANTNFAQFIAAKSNVPPVGTGVLPVNDAIFLGTMTFTATGSVGQSTNLVAEGIGPANFSELITFENFFVLDAVTDPSSLTVQVVPEPSLIFAVSLLVMLGYRRIVN
jgi:hypothetical protein